MRNFLLVPAAALTLIASGAAISATDIATFNVTAEVQAGCTSVTATALDFGAAGQIDTDTTATSTITVECSENQLYTVELDYGANAAGGIQRQVIGDTSFQAIDYDLYQDATETTPWGTEVEETGSSFSSAGIAAGTEDFTVYGVLRRNSGAEASLYSDIITVTLTF